MRALDQAGRSLLVVVGDRAEPRVELVAITAFEIVPDHVALCREPHGPSNSGPPAQAGIFSTSRADVVEVEISGDEARLVVIELGDHLAPTGR